MIWENIPSPMTRKGMDMADPPASLELTLDLLASSGFIHAGDSHDSAPRKLAGALLRCLHALNLDFVSIDTLTFDQSLKIIEVAVTSMPDCPYNLQACQIRDLDGESLLPVVQWLLDRVRTSQSNRGDESRRKAVVLNQLQRLRDKVSKDGFEIKVEMLVSLMQSLKDLERKESEFRSNTEERHSQLDDEICDLREKIASACDTKSVSGELNSSLTQLATELDSARKELAAVLRAILAVKRQLDDMPSQSELIQYERRFSELYGHIQGKHQQTQKYYDTYNALLEIKELMLKETSLLNSISSQFEDAITSTVGRSKLIDSMEGIVKSSQQKLVKVELGLGEQQRICDALKERYTAAIAAQRHWHSLLNAFQVECAKNERLRS